MSRGKVDDFVACAVAILLFALHRWFKGISSRPVWLAIKDVDVTSNYSY